MVCHNMSEQYVRVSLNILKTAILLCSSLMLCWTLDVVLFGMFLYGVRVDWEGWLARLAMILIVGHCCLSPLLYAVNYRPFRTALCRIRSQCRVKPQLLVRSQLQQQQRQQQLLQRRPRLTDLRVT